MRDWLVKQLIPQLIDALEPIIQDIVKRALHELKEGLDEEE